MRALSRAAPVFLLLVLTGCPGFATILPPETPAETLASAEISIQEQGATVIALVDAGIIKGETAAYGKEAIATVKQAIKAARLAVVSGNNPQPALSAVTAALTVLLRFIERHEGAG